MKRGRSGETHKANSRQHCCLYARLLVWAKTKDGQKGRSRPEPVVNRLLGVPSQRQATGFSCAAEFEAARARILGEG